MKDKVKNTKFNSENGRICKNLSGNSSNGDSYLNLLKDRQINKMLILIEEIDAILKKAVKNCVCIMAFLIFSCFWNFYNDTGCIQKTMMSLQNGEGRIIVNGKNGHDYPVLPGLYFYVTLGKQRGKIVANRWLEV